MKEVGTTILRIVVGTIYVMHAYVALLVSTPAGTAQFMEDVARLPAPTLMAWVLIVVHGLGGIMLILGFRSRWGAAANAVIVFVALVRIHLPQGFFLKGIVVDTAVGQAEATGYEFTLLLLGATVALIFLGSGPLAVKRSR